MNIEALRKNEEILRRHAGLVCSVPGFMYTDFSDEVITVYVKPENVEEAKAVLPPDLEGVSLRVAGRNNYPSF